MPAHSPARQAVAMDDNTRTELYEIRVNGEMGASLLNAFPDLKGHADQGVTVLTGRLPDQAALFGVLDQVQSLGLELLEIRRAA
jgi:hypothetical protein